MNKVKLKDVCNRITDGAHYSPVGISIGFPMLSVKDMEENKFNYSDCKYISEDDYNDLVRNDCKPLLNDVLIAKDGSYLKHVFVIREEIDQAILSSIGILRPNVNLVNPYYLKYYLQTKSVKETVAKKYVSGSALPRIILKNFGEIDLLLPDLSTQQKIASVLSALDDKIELNNKINAELEAMAKTLYDYWFVQFEFPITNESHPELVSGSHPKGYKSAGGKMVYNETLKREIPEGWEVKNLSSFINSDKSGDWGKEEEQGNYIVKVECIRGADINGINGKGDVKSPVRYILEKNNHKLLSENDFVVEISGGSPTQSTGRIACITKEVLQRFENPLICSNFCKAVSLKNEDEVNYFLSSWNRAYDNNILFGFEGKTSGIKNLLFENFVTAYDIAKPTSDLLKKFNNKISLFEKKRQENLKQNQELAQLRDWLLPMLMNGQVTVGDVADEFLGMVAEPFVDYQINNLTDKDKKIRRKMLATYIINQSLDDTSFGKTKFEKLLHLVESHIVKGDYNQKYSVQAAGPYDGGFTKVFWNEVTKSKWFEIKEFGKLKRIVAGENHIKSQKDYGYLSDELKELINNFISKFKNSNYERPEIVSTLFAVWNNRIIRNEMITDALLKKDFLEWDEQKARYENRLDDALAWMRNNNVVPTGWGNEIKRVKK